MSDVQNPIVSNIDPTVKPSGRFRKALDATGRGLRRGTTDITVWTTATVLTIVEPVVKLGEVVVHTADSKEDAIRNFGRNFIENRHARLVKNAESEVETLRRQLAEAKVAAAAAQADVVNNPAPEPGTSLRPAPAT